MTDETDIINSYEELNEMSYELDNENLLVDIFHGKNKGEAVLILEDRDFFSERLDITIPEDSLLGQTRKQALENVLKYAVKGIENCDSDTIKAESVALKHMLEKAQNGQDSERDFTVEREKAEEQIKNLINSHDMNVNSHDMNVYEHAHKPNLAVEGDMVVGIDGKGFPISELYGKANDTVKEKVRQLNLGTDGFKLDIDNYRDIRMEADRMMLNNGFDVRIYPDVPGTKTMVILEDSMTEKKTAITMPSDELVNQPHEKMEQNLYRRMVEGIEADPERSDKLQEFGNDLKTKLYIAEANNLLDTFNLRDAHDGCGPTYYDEKNNHIVYYPVQEGNGDDTLDTFKGEFDCDKLNECRNEKERGQYMKGSLAGTLKRCAKEADEKLTKTVGGKMSEQSKTSFASDDVGYVRIEKDADRQEIKFLDSDKEIYARDCIEAEKYFKEMTSKVEKAGQKEKTTLSAPPVKKNRQVPVTRQDLDME